MRVPVPVTMPAASELGRVHFVGIGGAGLSAIARIMLARGIMVSGSDGADSTAVAALRALGARVHVGHAAANVHDVDTLVVSTAIREDNPEYLAGVEQGLRILPRSAALASVMHGCRTIAVAGTHGKTTTTSLLTVALQAAGADPTYAIGGELSATGVNAAEGSSDLFVAEADESDGAFLHYAPHAAIVTNIDADHLDQWGTEEAYRAAFDEFAATINPGGFLVICTDDPGAAALAASLSTPSPATTSPRVLSYGLREPSVGWREPSVGWREPSVGWREPSVAPGEPSVAPGGYADTHLRAVDVRHDGTRTTFTVVRGAERLGEVELQIPGRHYVLNALAVLATGLELGLDFEALARGLGEFTGTRRRMERKGEVAGVRVYDTYAHHPTEIRGDLQAAREVAGEGRLIVAFQPHLVSRTRIFGEQMGTELGAADEVVVADVYVAREEPDPQVTGQLVADAVPLPADAVEFAPGPDDVAAALVRRAQPGDLVVTLGAGDITTVGPRVLELLRGRERDA